MYILYGFTAVLLPPFNTYENLVPGNMTFFNIYILVDYNTQNQTTFFGLFLICHWHYLI